jgi:hypothetical protein
MYSRNCQYGVESPVKFIKLKGIKLIYFLILINYQLTINNDFNKTTKDASLTS